MLARDAAKLEMRIDLFVIYLNRTLETFSSFLEFAALLMYEPEVVVGRGVRRIQRSRFKILLE